MNPSETPKQIPDNEQWLHTPEATASLDRALAWSDSHPRTQTNLKALAKKINRTRQRSVPARLACDSNSPT
ncbi:MAG: hypothetical protein NTV52_22740 [Acidobacteria bacterium]|nr:hypothetical protein [Acidobacteriota bacterium]